MNNFEEGFDNEAGQDGQLVENNAPRPLSKNQKITAVIFGVFAIAIIVLMLAQMRDNIRDPFRAPKVDPNKTSVATKAENSNDNIDPRLKDTDRDGLSDYDELNIYKTSPYIEDSDSDGFNDRIEVENNTDPNCPAGQGCDNVLSSQEAETPTSDKESVSSLSSVLLSPDQGLIGGGISASSTDEAMLQSLLSGQIDPALLRKLLLDNGMEKEYLDQLSDEDLVKSYQETLNKDNSQ